MLSRTTKPRRILVAIDGSACSMSAADYAISIAYNAQLIALNVSFSELEYAYSLHVLEFMTPTAMKAKTEVERAEANQWFGVIKDKISKKGINSIIRLKTDFILTAMSIPHAIVDYAQVNNIDLIVVGTRGRSGLKRVLLGSVASGVVTYSSRPVLVTK
jgi:nucleotide-binding universal stress UspA family protein